MAWGLKSPKGAFSPPALAKTLFLRIKKTKTPKEPPQPYCILPPFNPHCSFQPRKQSRDTLQGDWEPQKDDLHGHPFSLKHGRGVLVVVKNIIISKPNNLDLAKLNYFFQV